MEASGRLFERDDLVRIRTDLALRFCCNKAFTFMNNRAKIAAASAALAFLYGNLVPIGGGGFLP
jgi:hypothetical protein